MSAHISIDASRFLLQPVLSTIVKSIFDYNIAANGFNIHCMRLYGIAICLLSAVTAWGQSAADDSALYKKAVYHTIGVYHQTMGDQSGLFNGIQYAQFPFSFADNAHPFFKDDKPGTASVIYDNVLYENVQMQYDEVQDVVFMQDSSRRIQLLNQRVTAFTLFGNSFIRLVKDSANAVLVNTGFYNLLYSGSTRLLKKEEKMIREDVSTGVIIRYIEVMSHYYIDRNNTWYSIKSKNGLLDIFKDRKKDLRQFIKKNKLNYRKDRDNMLVKVTAYYDQLTK